MLINLVVFLSIFKYVKETENIILNIPFNNNNKPKQVEHKKLELENKCKAMVVIPVREDGYMDATAICQAGGKEFKHWYSNNRTKEIIKELSLDVGCVSSKLVTINKNNYKNKHTFVHPILAISISQWVSPKFHIKICNYALNLFTYGKCEIGKVKDMNETVSKIKSEYKKKYEKVLKRRKRKELLNSKNCVYIISNPLEGIGKFKIGIASELKNRLSTFNTGTSCAENEYVVEFSLSFHNIDDAKTVEGVLHRKFNYARISQNKEWFEEDKNIIIDKLKELHSSMN